MFRCRVDFKLSPTRNSVVHLEVVGKLSSYIAIFFASVRKIQHIEIMVWTCHIKSNRPHTLRAHILARTQQKKNAKCEAHSCEHDNILTNWFCVLPVPPQKPRIFDDRYQIIQAMAGPYDEGSNLTLYCEVRGGSPQPKITWLFNGKQTDGITMDTAYGVLKNRLVIKNLSRTHLYNIITCRASNFPKTETTANVTLDMRCK